MIASAVKLFHELIFNISPWRVYHTPREWHWLGDYDSPLLLFVPLDLRDILELHGLMPYMMPNATVWVDTFEKFCLLFYVQNADSAKVSKMFYKSYS